jgi:hypothetical protein
MLQYRSSPPNRDGLQVAKPNLQSALNKPGADEGPSLARARTTKVGNASVLSYAAWRGRLRGSGVVQPGQLAPREIDAMPVEVGTFAKGAD